MSRMNVCEISRRLFQTLKQQPITWKVTISSTIKHEVEGKLFSLTLFSCYSLGKTETVSLWHVMYDKTRLIIWFIRQHYLATLYTSG